MENNKQSKKSDKRDKAKRTQDHARRQAQLDEIFDAFRMSETRHRRGIERIMQVAKGSLFSAMVDEALGDMEDKSKSLSEALRLGELNISEEKRRQEKAIEEKEGQELKRKARESWAKE